ncbi:MAG TPA: hypothetical protein VKZ60_03080 [Chloroflexota bacterium]|nr:hypothetical protein [Chloroflexota bacterium]
MDGSVSMAGGMLLTSPLPRCEPVVAEVGMLLVVATALLAGRVLAELLRWLRAKLGHPDPTEPSRSRSAQLTVQEIAARLRHDSPGGWTAGETRWTLAHEYGWFTSPDYRAFILSMVVILVGWSFSLRVAHFLCE